MSIFKAQKSTMNSDISEFFKKDMIDLKGYKYFLTGIANRIVDKPVNDAFSTGLKYEDKDLSVLVLEASKELRRHSRIVIISNEKDIVDLSEKRINPILKEFVVLNHEEYSFTESGKLLYKDIKIDPSRWVELSCPNIWNESLIKAIYRYEALEDEQLRVIKDNSLLVYKINNLNSALAKDTKLIHSIKERVRLTSTSRDNTKTLACDSTDDFSYVSFDTDYIVQNIEDCQKRLSLYSAIPQQILFGLQQTGFNTSSATKDEYDFLLQQIRRDMWSIIDFYNKTRTDRENNELLNNKELSNAEKIDELNALSTSLVNLVDSGIVSEKQARQAILSRLSSLSENPEINKQEE